MKLISIIIFSIENQNNFPQNFMAKFYFYFNFDRVTLNKYSLYLRE